MDQALHNLYWYCTDFCIHMANLLGISYVEWNFWLFLVMMPGILLLLIGLNGWTYVIKPRMNK